jgi:hypothetical protein
LDQLARELLGALKWPSDADPSSDQLPLSYWRVTRLVNAVRRRKGMEEVTHVAVRNRWAQLTSSVIRGIQVIPESSYMGLQRSSIAFSFYWDSPSNRRFGVDAELLWRSVGGGEVERVSVGRVYDTARYLARLEVLHAGDDEIQETLHRVEEFLRVNSGEVISVNPYVPLYTPTKWDSGRKERKVLALLTSNPRSVLESREFSEQVRRLTASRSFRIEPVLDGRKFIGGLMYQVVCFSNGGGVMGLKSTLGDRVLLAKDSFRGLDMVVSFADSVSELDGVLSKVSRELPGASLLWRHSSYYNRENVHYSALLRETRAEGIPGAQRPCV